MEITDFMSLLPFFTYGSAILLLFIVPFRHKKIHAIIEKIYFAFFSLLIKRQTHKAAKATVATISIGHTGIGQTPALISFSP